MGNLGPTIQDLIQKSSSKKSKSQATTTDDSEINPDEYDSVTGKFNRKMTHLKLLEFEQATEQKAQKLGVRYLNLAKYAVPPEALEIIDEKKAKELKTLCFYRDQKMIKIATRNPIKDEVQKLIINLKEELFVNNIDIYYISENSFKKLYKQYANLPKITKITKGVNITEEDLNKFTTNVTILTDLQEQLSKANTSQIVTAIIAMALQVRASDIHIEAEEKDVKIRYRVDGILNDAASLPKEDWTKITTRIKLLSSLKLNIENKPQDGRFTIFLKEDNKVDVRVSVIPTTFGESIVMRLLKSSATGLKFESLGLKGLALQQLSNEIDKPNGMIVTTGPTGSGKTTTLYAILNKLNTPENKIITLEDPVEYKLKGINQSQIDHSKGYNFADGLRSVLRQDPDIVMVGEIRDLETAEVAMNAALTGHLVISTLHTNSAAAALPRFISMGVKPFLLSPALNSLIGQRLVRRICPDCKQSTVIKENTLASIKKILSEIPESSGEKIDVNNLTVNSFFKGKGCENCHGIGFKGRIGIYEVMNMNKEIEESLTSRQLSEYIMADIAKKHGMVTMVQDGLLKTIDGITTVEEVFRVAKTLD